MNAPWIEIIGLLFKSKIVVKSIDIFTTFRGEHLAGNIYLGVHLTFIISWQFHRLNDLFRVQNSKVMSLHFYWNFRDNFGTCYGDSEAEGAHTNPFEDVFVFLLLCVVLSSHEAKQIG